MSNGVWMTWWVVVAHVTLPCFICMEGVPLGCQEGWTLIGVHCYRVFPHQMAWDLSFDVCQRYGSQLLRAKDLDGKEPALATLAANHGVSHLWLAYPSISVFSQHHPTGNFSHDQLQHHHHHHHHHHHQQQQLTISPAFHGNVMPSAQDVGHFPDVTLGHGSGEGGHVTGSGTVPEQCVLARVVGGGRAVWGVAPCSRLTAFLCQRPAAPAESFACITGGFVRQKFVCDGEEDCDDASDEMDCEALCSRHIQGVSGLVTTAEWTHTGQAGPVVRQCRWLLEAPLGYNARIQLTDLAIKPGQDEIVVLMGGMTVSTSREVARVCGVEDKYHFESINNFLIVIFTSEINNATVSRFSASYTAVKAEGFEPHKELSATAEAQDLLSPFYPGYVSGQDYVWVITALHDRQTVTLQIAEVDLSSSDKVEIRDGNSVYSPLLQVRTSSWRTDRHVTHVQSTGRHMFIAFRTRSLHTGKGFHFRYWQGCSIRVEDRSGVIVSPGYLIKGANYPINQTCVYEVAVPELQTATLIFDTVDIHPSDELRVESDGQWVYPVRGTDLPGPMDLSSGHFHLVFRSDDKLTGRGFSLRFSVGCPRKPANSHTTKYPRSLVHHFGSTLTLTCSHGYAFPPQEPRPQSEATTSLDLECLFGGTWNSSGTHVCKAQCQPGWFYDEETDSCKVCPKNFYQRDVNATSCRACPKGTVTEREGTNSSSDCKTACAAGQRYCRGQEGCEDCPVGTYQSLPAQFTCLPCPLFRTTPRPGANSPTLCTIEVLDKDTEQELNDQNLIVVSFQDKNPNHHHHHHHHHRQHHNRSLSHGSSARRHASFSAVLLPSGRSPFNASSIDPPETASVGSLKQKGSMLISGMTVPQHASKVSYGHSPGEADGVEDLEESPDPTHPEGSRWGRSDADNSEESRGESSDVMMSPEGSEKKDLAWKREQTLLAAAKGLEPGHSERVKRETSEGQEEVDDAICSGSGSGDDACQMTSGQPCNDTQDCVPDCDSYKCVCKPTYLTSPSGQCVDLPESHKLFMASPLALTFDPDLSLQNSIAFLTFQKECQEAFTDIFRVVEGWKATQVLFFRSEDGGNEQTIVVYALLFSVGVTGEMKVRTAQSVLHMERLGADLGLQIGSRKLFLAGHTGVFDTLVDTFTSSDDVDWCGAASLHQCEGGKECVDGELRYTCQCSKSTIDVAGACVNVGAVVGGVVGGVVAIIIIIVVVIVVVIRRRRKAPREYSRPEELKQEETQLSYSALTASPHQEPPPDPLNDNPDPAEPSVYSEISGPRTSHQYDAFRFNKDGEYSNTPTTQDGFQSDAIELAEQNVYNRVSGPLTTHAYDAFRFGKQGAEDAGTSEPIPDVSPSPYANIGAETASGASSTPSVPGTSTEPLQRHSTGVYMNVGGTCGRGAGKDPVYSNIGLQ